MGSYLIYGAGALLVLWWLLGRGPSLLGVIKEAETQHDIQPIMEAVAQLPGRRRSFFFQRSIEILWHKWERELATHLIIQYATLHPDEKLSQYWIQQVLELEPKTAKRAFSTSFLDTYYQPDVASACGVASS